MPLVMPQFSTWVRHPRRQAGGTGSTGPRAPGRVISDSYLFQALPRKDHHRLTQIVWCSTASRVSRRHAGDAPRLRRQDLFRRCSGALPIGCLALAATRRWTRGNRCGPTSTAAAGRAPRGRAVPCTGPEDALDDGGLPRSGEAFGAAVRTRPGRRRRRAAPGPAAVTGRGGPARRARRRNHRRALRPDAPATAPATPVRWRRRHRRVIDPPEAGHLRRVDAAEATEARPPHRSRRPCPEPGQQRVEPPPRSPRQRPAYRVLRLGEGADPSGSAFVTRSPYPPVSRGSLTAPTSSPDRASRNAASTWAGDRHPTWPPRSAVASSETSIATRSNGCPASLACERPEASELAFASCATAGAPGRKIWEYRTAGSCAIARRLAVAPQEVVLRRQGTRASTSAAIMSSARSRAGPVPHRLRGFAAPGHPSKARCREAVPGASQRVSTRAAPRPAGTSCSPGGGAPRHAVLQAQLPDLGRRVRERDATTGAREPALVGRDLATTSRSKTGVPFTTARTSSPSPGVGAPSAAAMASARKTRQRRTRARTSRSSLRHA